MNTVNNKRKRKSQELIEKVFIELIQTKEINEVSVTDICKRANLNRTTFYSSYLDIYDLADKLRVKLEKEVAGLYADVDDTNYSYDNFLRIFKHIKENQIFYRTYFKLGFDKGDIVDEYLSHSQADKYYSKETVAYHAEFFKAGFNAVIKKWRYSGCAESPEEMMEIIKTEYMKNL